MAQSSLAEYVCSDATLQEKAWNIIKELDTFTVDTLHVLEPEIARLHRDKRVLGAVLAGLKRKGLISEVGYVKSTRETCHYRPVMAWKVKT